LSGNLEKIGQKVLFSTADCAKMRGVQYFPIEVCEGGFMAAGMTKSQVVRYLAEKTSLSNKDTAAFLEQVVDLAVKEAKKNGLFVLPGLGRLKKVHRKARMGRNPQTGEAIKIAAKTTAKFYLAKSAKDAIAPKKA
jgi:DNA-binding protein HU-beta